MFVRQLTFTAEAATYGNQELNGGGVVMVMIRHRMSTMQNMLLSDDMGGSSNVMPVHPLSIVPEGLEARSHVALKQDCTTHATLNKLH